MSPPNLLTNNSILLMGKFEYCLELPNFRPSEDGRVVKAMDLKFFEKRDIHWALPAQVRILLLAANFFTILLDF